MDLLSRSNSEHSHDSSVITLEDWALIRRLVAGRVPTDGPFHHDGVEHPPVAPADIEKCTDVAIVKVGKGRGDALDPRDQVLEHRLWDRAVKARQASDETIVVGRVAVGTWWWFSKAWQTHAWFA